MISASLCAGLLLAGASATPASALAPASNCVAGGPMPNASAPLVVEVSDEFGPYGGDHVVLVSDSSGLPLVTLACTGPLDTLMLAPGSYRVMAFISDVRSQEVAVNVPPNGTTIRLLMEPAPGAQPRGPNVVF